MMIMLRAGGMGLQLGLFRAPRGLRGKMEEEDEAMPAAAWARVRG
jgi:hypothetical protein